MHEFGTEEHDVKWQANQIFETVRLTARRIKEAGHTVKLAKGQEANSYALTVDGEAYTVCMFGNLVQILDKDGALRGSKFAWGDPELCAVCLADGFLLCNVRVDILGPEPKGMWARELEKE